MQSFRNLSSNLTSNLSSITTKKRQVRYTGIIACSFVSVQCVIWIILTSLGICFFYIQDVDEETGLLTAAIKKAYFDTSGKIPNPCIVTPVIFHIICWIYFVGSIVWLVISIKLTHVLHKWTDFLKIQKLLKTWVFFTLIICGVDFISFVLFTADFHYLLPMTVKLKARADDSIALYKTNMEALIDHVDVINVEKLQIRHLQEELKNELREYFILKNKLKRRYLNEADKENKFQNPFVLPFKISKREDSSVSKGLVQRPKSETKWPQWVELPAVPASIMMQLSIRGYLAWMVNLLLCLLMYKRYF